MAIFFMAMKVNTKPKKDSFNPTGGQAWMDKSINI
jgi:hypothetical protein